MRVALTTESYLPYLSGVTISVDALARGLGARGHEVLVIAPRPARGDSPLPEVGSPGPEPRYAWLASYQLPRVAPPGYRMPWPNPFDDAWDVARAFDPDVVHAHSPFVTGLLARRLARATDAPLVFTHHTRFGDYGHYLGPLAAPGSALTGAYIRRFWAGCAAIIAPSTDLASEIRSRMPAERADRVRVVPTGVDVAGIRALRPIDLRSAAGWASDVVVVATLGRLAPEKSVTEILEAVAIACAAHPSTRLAVIGGGPSEADLRSRAAAPDLAGRVHFTGALPRPDALAHLASADLFAFASVTETQGLVLAEAAAAGLPAAAVRGPGVEDTVRDGVDGLIVDADPSATRAQRLADAIGNLVADATRRREMAAAAREGAQRFAVEARVAEVERVYRSVVA